MNKKGNNIKSYVILVIILLAALIFIFYLLDSEKKNRQAKPITEETNSASLDKNSDKDKTTSTTILVDNNKETNVTVNVEKVSNFAASLSDIIGNTIFSNDYDITTYFHGVEFDFKCTNFDEEANTCTSGSALMKVEDVLYPLYTYSNDQNNYLRRSDDYYIILNDELVILYTSYSGVSTGNARIFDRSGKQITTLQNTLTSYLYKDKLYTKIYPNIKENTFYYYSCSNNHVLIKYTELSDLAKQAILESVEGSCYK